MTSWSEQIERRAKLIHSEIAAWQSRGRELGINPDEACAPFYALLNEIYGEDLPLAQAKDASDLLLHFEGRAVDNAPRISFISGLFNNVKVQVRDLTKAISGILPDKRVAVTEIDLGLSGIAKGSLFVGFNVPFPRERELHESILRDQDPIFRATKDALRIINKVSHNLEIGEPDRATRHVAQVVDDPKVRDAALVAIRRLSPSGRQGISRIGVTAAHERRSPAQLTPELRSQLGRMLFRPVVGKEVLQLEGTIRGIDLDAKRFDLRGISDHNIHDIRCVYSHLESIQPRTLLDARVRVRGIVERRPDETPRLMDVQNIDVLNSPDEPQLF